MNLVARWGLRARIGVLALTVALLLGLSAAGGWAGLFSSAERRLGRELLDPTTRLSAAVELSEQYAEEIVSGRPMIPGAQGEQACPASWAAEASTIVGGLSRNDATAAMVTALRRFGSAGWRLTTPLSAGPTTSFVARRRNGLRVEVSEQVADTASTLQVRLSVPCPTTRKATAARAARTP